MVSLSEYTTLTECLTSGVQSSAAAAGCRAGVPGQQAAAERVDRQHFAGAVQLAHRVAAVVQVESRAGAVGLPGPQAVGAVGGPPVEAPHKDQPVLRVEDQGIRRVRRQVAATL